MMNSHRPAQGEAPSRSLLCLKCRGIGHIVNNCPFRTWSSEFGWFFSPARMATDFGDASSTVQQELCKRCQDLDVLGLLHEDMPWESLQHLDQAVRNGSDLVRSIGTTGSIQFEKDCPLCCCLFAMTPHPNSPAQEVLILPHWTMNRLTGENGANMDTNEKRQYAKCLLVALKPNSLNLTFSITAHRGDALCILEGDDADYATTLGGRLVESHSLNTGIIEEWLSACSRLHGSNCNPVYTGDLQGIRLIDVLEQKPKVVNYPQKCCEYVALSYVWGGVAPQSFKLGSVLGKLPQTIEDAIACVRLLGKRYLWVDWVCIDQFDKKDKRDQIGKMWSIYRGAYVTLIALSGESADTGLPRFGSNKRFHPQLSCCIGKKRLVGLMPTLSQQVWMSPWGTRAWTLQEALLSLRCLYLSDHQLYFECNAMQCCESLDQTKSWAHNLSSDSNPTQKTSLEWLFEQNGPGCLKNPLDSPTHRLEHWGAKVTLYSYRSMTKDEDALNAFLGVLQRLETMYESGFFWGLPVADFQWALLWQSQSPPERRKGFPTWSWAGWKTGVWPGYPFDVTMPHQYPVHLQLWKLVKAQLVEVFRTPRDTTEGSTDVEPPFRNDLITNAAVSDLQSPGFDTSQYPRAQDDGYLFVEAIVFHFTPDYSHPVYNIHRHGAPEIFVTSIRGTRCSIQIMSTDREIRRSAEQAEQLFLLLARDRRGGLVYHHLLLVHPRGDLVERGTVIQLLIPEGRLEVLEELKVGKRRVVLA